MTEDESNGRKKTVAAGALGLGATAVGLASRGASQRSELALQQVPGQALVFAYDYNPGLSFTVINRLQQGTVDTVLGREVGQNGDPIVSDPADYNGYVIRYQPDQDAGEYALVFVREATLEIGGTLQFGTDATFFNTQANLITAGLESGDGETETPTDETTTETETETATPETETATPEDGTTTTTTTETTPADGGENETTTAAVEINATTTQPDGG